MQAGLDIVRDAQAAEQSRALPEVAHDWGIFPQKKRVFHDLVTSPGHLHGGQGDRLLGAAHPINAKAYRCLFGRSVQTSATWCCGPRALKCRTRVLGVHSFVGSFDPAGLDHRMIHYVVPGGGVVKWWWEHSAGRARRANGLKYARLRTYIGWAINDKPDPECRTRKRWSVAESALRQPIRTKDGCARTFGRELPANTCCRTNFMKIRHYGWDERGSRSGRGSEEWLVWWIDAWLDVLAGQRLTTTKPTPCGPDESVASCGGSIRVDQDHLQSFVIAGPSSPRTALDVFDRCEVANERTELTLDVKNRTSSGGDSE